MKDTWTSEDNIKDDLLSPLFKKASTIKIATGYFSVTIFEMFYDELSEFAEKGELFQLIIGSDTNPNSIKILQEIYIASEDDAPELLNKTLFKEMNTLSDKTVKLIYDLCNKDMLEIKIGMTEDGIYHQKSYLYNKEDEFIVINGSLNLTRNAILNNFEVIDVHSTKAKFHTMNEIFEKCWNNQVINNTVKPINEYLLSEVINEADKRNLKLLNDTSDNGITLRPYQEEAISFLVENDYNGFLEMATGTGKTFTALQGLKEYLSDNKIRTTFIVVPYRHLATQWEQDVRDIFGETALVLICEGSKNWRNEINRYSSLSDYFNVFVIAVKNTMFDNYEYFKNLYFPNRVLIVDEAHNLTMKHIDLLNSDEAYTSKVGLSATPVIEGDVKRTNGIMSLFGGEKFIYNLNEAIRDGYLTEYEYKVEKVSITSAEREEYRNIKRKLRTARENGEGGTILKMLEEQTELFSRASNKIESMKKILLDIPDLKHTIVYCNQGELKEDFTYINEVSRVINEISPRNIEQITYKEDLKDRQRIVKEFTEEKIDVILAIKCLDEGYNIPAIKRAFILYSTSKYREYVQRRGRILRRFGDKEVSEIYDFIVEIDNEIPYLEHKRFNEYASLAMNKDELNKFYLDNKWEEIIYE